MPVTAVYASLLALLFIFLSFRTISQRRSARVEIGAGEDRELLRRMRVHANFAEYTPMALVLLALAESLALMPLLLHGIGLMLLVGRAVHAYALSQEPHVLKLRVLGMQLTFAAIVFGAVACLILGAMRLV